jgi:CheY-like chemotaxis protein
LLNGGETMKKVLVVNDCKFERIIIKDCLSDIGYNVEIASEYDALLKVKKFQPDILIANLIMKNTTGDRLIKRIKSENSQIVCLLSSCDSISLGNYTENNVDEVIHTPIDKLELSKVLNRIISCSDVTEESNVDDAKKQDDVIFNKKSSETLTKFLFCPFCGQKLSGTSQSFRFCPYCGEKITANIC